VFRIRGVLSGTELDEIDRLLEGGNFIDGRASAGFAGQTIKSNLEMDPQDPNGAAAGEIVQAALRKNKEFIDYAMPIKISGILFNRYLKGMKYEDHNDNVVNLCPPQVLRNDMSFTLFLSSPDEYEGGELMISVLDNEMPAKYDRGDMVVYPSGLIHRVNEVMSGGRTAAVGMLQSSIPQQDRRELVNAVRQVRNDILETAGRTKNLKLMEFVLTNLQRMWIQL
jgi:PKHD-type hydroxylase